MQLQFEDGVGLLRGERLLGIKLRSASGGVDVDLLAAKVRDQILSSVAAVGAAANDRDHVIEVIERGQVAFQNVLAIARFIEQIRSAPPHHIDAMVDEVFDRLDQPHFLRLAVDHGQQDHAEAFLHRRVLEELVEHDLRFGSALEFDHNAHAVAIAFVANVGDVVDGLLVDQVGDALDQARLVHLIRNLGNDDRLLFLGDVLDGGAGAHHETSAASAVSLEDSGASVNDGRPSGSPVPAQISKFPATARWDYSPA